MTKRKWKQSNDHDIYHKHKESNNLDHQESNR